MAVLTRPLFHSQERIDLEDLNQLLSGLRTDARLLTRQLYEDKNFILKGFSCTGFGSDTLSVSLTDATLLFSGRQDSIGTADITIDTDPTSGATVTFSVGTTTQVVTEGVDWNITAGNARATAESLATAINGLDNLTTELIGTAAQIRVSASLIGYTTIVISPSTGFPVGTIPFVYPTVLQESPSDLSYFIIQSDATTAEQTISRTINASERAAVGTATKTLYIYGTLSTTQGTPITKAFWDPSANSGVGAEFNQSVNTAVDLSMALLVSESPLDTTTEANAATFFANVAIAEIEVDTSGIIIGIRDARPLLLESDDQRPWNRTENFAQITTDDSITNVTIGNGLTANVLDFTLDETIEILGLNTTTVLATAKLEDVINSTATPSTGESTLQLDKFDLTTIAARASMVRGATSGAIRIVNQVNSNFFRDDKDIGNFRNMFSALATEIKNVKGTDRWYDDPPATVKDLLRFINSTIIGIETNARYEWNASGTSDGTLDIKLDPINDPANPTTLTVLTANGLVAATTITFTNTTSANTIVLTAITSGTPTSIQFLKGSDAEQTASNIAGTINGSGAPNLSATFAESGNSGNYVISLFSNDRTYSTVSTSAAATVFTISPTTPVAGAFTYLNADTDLANIRFYGLDRNFLIRQHTLTIGVEEVLFVTLPDLDTDTALTDIIYSQTEFFRYSQSGPTINRATWNSTNRDLFVNATDRFKSVPIADYESNDRNYWIAYRDNSETIFVRDIGELGNNESANIGQGITNATLSYIGAPDENDSTPDYPSVTTINDFGLKGEFTATIVTTGGNTKANLSGSTITVPLPGTGSTPLVFEFITSGTSTNIAVDISDSAIDTDAEFASTLQGVINGRSEFTATVVSNVVSVIQVESGTVTDPSTNDTTNIGLVVTTSASPGAYVAGGSSPSDFNETIVSQSENLTSAISDLNDHLTSITNTQYQNAGMKLVGEAFFSWDITFNSSNVETGNSFAWGPTGVNTFLQVPNLTDSENTIAPATFTGFAAGEILFVDINRNSIQNKTLTPTKISISSFEPRRDRIIIARRVGDFVYVGVNGTIRLSNGQSAPLDSSLQFLGLQGNQLPRQLNTHVLIQSPLPSGVAQQSVDIETSDVFFPVGGNTTSTSLDDNVELSLSIGASLLFWEGATFDMINGQVYNEITSTTATPFRNRLSTGAGEHTFTAITPANNMEVYYVISLTGTTTILATDAEVTNGNIPSTAVGRIKGEFAVDRGQDAVAGMATFPEFSGTIAVAYIKISQASNVITTLVDTDLTILASAGGGGGGTGNANQDINDYLNRLSLSTFEFLTPLAAAVSISNDIDPTNTNGSLSSSGYGLQANQTFTTTQLLDPEFIAEEFTPERFEIQSTWVEDEDRNLSIDPNAKWFISLNSADTVSPDQFTPLTFSRTGTLVGWIDNAGTLIGTNLSGITPSVTNNNIIFVENHGLSTGHIIDFPTGFATLNPSVFAGETLSADTKYYVHVVDEDSFTIYNTRVLADAGAQASRNELQGTTFGAVTFGIDAGILPRLGITSKNRAVFDTRLATLTGAAYTAADATIRLRVVGDANAGERSQANDGEFTSLAMFYKDELGVEGVNPNGLDDVNDILRSSHLVNSVDSNSSYGVAGRGVVLLNNAATPVNTEIALDANNNITIDGTAPITTNGATVDQILVADANGNFAPADAEASAGIVPAALKQITTSTSPNTESRLGGVARPTIFSYTEATWVCPADITAVYVEMAGGGTSGNTATSLGGTNGFPGKWYQGWHGVVPGETYNLRLGNPGAGSTTTGEAQNGGPSRFSGTIDGQASAIIDTGEALCPEGGGTGSAGALGTLTFTNLNVGQIGAGSNTNSPEIGNAWMVNNPAVDNWNVSGLWVTPGPTGAGGNGGSTPIATGGATVGSDAGGGAGFLDGSGGTTNGGRGGAGGIRLTYYRATAQAITVGSNVINT